MVWRILSWVSIAAAAACLGLAMIFNPEPRPSAKDIPWMIGFLIFTIMAPILWARGDRNHDQR